MAPPHRIDVIAMSGYRAEQRPVAVTLDGERLDVTRIEDRWISTGVDTGSAVVRGFVVRCQTGARFRLLFTEGSGEERGWSAEILPGPRLAVGPSRSGP